MTKFSYSDYLSQFRQRGADRRRGSPEPPEDADPVVLAIRSGDVEALNELAAAASRSLLRENKDGWLPLHDAAFTGQTGCLQALLRAHPGSVDKRTLQEQTALLLAASRQQLDCVRSLLESGADPDICDSNRETPLYKACQLQNVELVKLVLSHGATVNQRCGQGRTALHQAVSKDNTEICDILVGAGAAINPANTYSVTPLIVAAQRGLMRALRYLLEKGADVNMQTCDGVTALHEASKNGHKPAAALLLAKNADANKPESSGLLPLHVAAQHGYPEIVSLLVPVTSRATLRHSGVSPLHLAAQHDRHAAAAVLLRAGADVNATLAPGRSARYADRRSTPLCFAAAHGSRRTAEVLLEAGASLSLDPVSPLLVAAWRGCVRTVSLLLQRGADANAALPSGAAGFPAAVALCQNNLPLLRCLLNHGCDARSCFACAHGADPHPAPTGPSITAAPGQTSDWPLPVSWDGGAEREAQFCEWISTPAMCEWAGPVVELLLEHVGHVRLCSRLAALLDSREEWRAIRSKARSPRALQHLCRLKIWTQMGTNRRSIPGLPLPNRLKTYLHPDD